MADQDIYETNESSTAEVLFVWLAIALTVGVLVYTELF